MLSRVSPAMRWALAISLAVHGLLLAGIVVLPKLQMRAEPPAAISAVLAHSSQAVAADASPPSATAPPSRTVPATGVRERAALSAIMAVPAAEMPATARVASAPPAAPAAPSPAAPLPAADRSALSASGDADNALASADALREYKIALSSQARRFKRYPALARERGWQGTVGVEIRVLPQASLPEAVLARQSGFDLLDDQAVDMMRQAVAWAAVPEPLRRRGARFVLPVVFSLDE